MATRQVKNRTLTNRNHGKQSLIDTDTIVWKETTKCNAKKGQNNLQIFCIFRYNENKLITLELDAKHA